MNKVYRLETKMKETFGKKKFSETSLFVILIVNLVLCLPPYIVGFFPARNLPCNIV